MEEIFSNIDLVTYMCKFLNFEQQLQLAQVSDELRNSIVNYVWKINCQEIQIIINGMESFVVTDKRQVFENDYKDYFDPDIWQRKSLILTSKNLENFLNLNANNIYKLQLITNRDSDESIWNVLTLGLKFPNLNELHCRNIKCENIDLQQIAENCPKIVTLILNNCLRQKGRFSEIGLNIDKQILYTMQNFNNLCIYNRHYNFSCLNDIVKQLKLQQYTTNDEGFEDLKKNALNSNNFKYYKELDLPNFKAYSDFQYFQINFLTHLENLCHLSLGSISVTHKISITKKFFNDLTKSCKSLTHLNLRRFIINDFINLNTLTELYVDDCEGLKYSNLKTILNGMHLKCFKSNRSKYEGNFENFSISQTLQKLDIDLYDNNVIIKLLELNEANLLNLTEFHYSNAEKLKVSKFAKNIRVLSISTGKLIAEDYFKLKYLQEIILTHSSIALSDLLLLLKLENLYKLSFWNIVYTHDQTSVVLSEMKAFQTNLQHLRLFKFLKSFIIDFLFDFLNINTQLSFACHIEHAKSIAEIVSQETFPKRFKYINVCGVSIDCNSIRNRCEKTMHQIGDLIKTLEITSLKPYFIVQ
ncbi:uncharacterized protein LOC124420146 [Lucilia cuprina]|uniref:uncharacterized protein LOC124420146 n=1 Tax=Lucilia cuprina TaxID=7375 RepID=UPI001F0517BB|nr:uncharacterized protein LOC124420146 [Lucilia cuprina]